MPEQRPSRSAKAKAKAILTRRVTRGNIRHENDDGEHEDIELDPRKMHVGMRKAFQTMADKYQSDVLDPASAIHKDQLVAMNKQMKKSIHPAMPKVHVGRNGWSRKDENDVLDQWEAEKDRWTNIPDVKIYHMLWKICLQYAKCTPWDIVGFNTKLSFELSCRGDLGGQVDENHTWSSDFGEHLAWLIPHPAWAGVESPWRSALLATAIQYAVILRTNDQRVWRLSQLGDEFLMTFATLCRENCPCSIAGIHAKVLAHRREKGIKTIPIISRVFQSLEKVIQTPTDSFVPADEEPYFVTTQDLTNLILALDQIVDPGTNLRMFLPVEFVYESAQSAHGGRQPPTREQLHEYHKLALIEEMRRKAKATRLTQSIRDSDGGDGGGDDDDPFAPESLTGLERPTRTTSTTRRQRLDHVSATPSSETSPLAGQPEARGLDSEPRPTRTRPSSARITQSPGLDSDLGLNSDGDESRQSSRDASERESLGDFGFGDGFHHDGESDMSGGSGHDDEDESGLDLGDKSSDVVNDSCPDDEEAPGPGLGGDVGSGPSHDDEDAPGPDLGAGSGGPGHDGEDAPEPLDDDAMSVNNVDADHGLYGTREEPAPPRPSTNAPRHVRLGRVAQKYVVNLRRMG